MKSLTDSYLKAGKIAKDIEMMAPLTICDGINDKGYWITMHTCVFDIPKKNT